MGQLSKKAQLIVSITAGYCFLLAITVTPQVHAQSLDQQVKQLERKLIDVQDALAEVKAKSIQEAQKVREVEELTATAKDSKERKNHRVFFRGGFAHSMQNRNGVTIQSNVAPVGAQDQADKNAWYIGAGFDFNLSNDLWGLMPKTSAMAELMFEYKQFGANVQGNVLANAPTQLAGGTLNPRRSSTSCNQPSI